MPKVLGDGPNLYVYVKNSPTMCIDHKGLDSASYGACVDAANGSTDACYAIVKCAYDKTDDDIQAGNKRCKEDAVNTWGGSLVGDWASQAFEYFICDAASGSLEVGNTALRTAGKLLCASVHGELLSACQQEEFATYIK